MIKNRFFQTAVVLIAPTALIGCMTTQVMEPIKQQEVQTSIHIGDRLHVIEKNGVILDLQVSSIDKVGISGVADGKSYSLPFAQIKEIDRAKLDKGKTAVLGTVGLVATYVVVVLAAAALFAHVFFH